VFPVGILSAHFPFKVFARVIDQLASGLFVGLGVILFWDDLAYLLMVAALLALKLSSFIRATGYISLAVSMCASARKSAVLNNKVFFSYWSAVKPAF
jgi:hypothetical protein